MDNKHTFLYLMIFQQFKTRDKKKRTNMHKSKTNKVLIECGHISMQSNQTEMSIIRQTLDIIGCLSLQNLVLLCTCFGGWEIDGSTYDILMSCPHLYRLEVHGI